MSCVHVLSNEGHSPSTPTLPRSEFSCPSYELLLALRGTRLEGDIGDVQDRGTQRQVENTKEMKRLEKEREVKMRETKKDEEKR